MAGPVRGVDTLLPAYDAREIHRRVYPAEPSAVRDAVESLTADDLRLTRLLMGIRLLPARLAGRGTRRPSRPLVDHLPANGFARVVDTPDEVVFAVIGRFWRPDGGRKPSVTDAAAFRAFAEPGYAKAVMSFELRAGDGDTELATETRIRATSTGARRAFLAYWLFVRPGSSLIRREILSAVGKRVAARHPDRAPHADRRSS